MSTEKERRPSIKKGHFLDEIPGIEKEVVDKLKGLSLSTAYEFTGYELTMPDDLKNYLGLKDEQMDRLMQLAIGALSPDEVAGLITFVPPKRYLRARDPMSGVFRSEVSRAFNILRNLKKEPNGQS